jgi:phosphatidylglycerol:prolipoprotein diacylglycerol transferase
MFPFLRIGPLLLNFSGLAALVGIWIAISLTEKEARRMQLDVNQVSSALLVGLVAGVIGARLGYALQYLQAFISNPLSLFSLNPGTFLPWAGLLTGILAAVVYGRRRGLYLRPTLDALAPGLAAFLVSLGISHFLSGNAYGAPADLPWSIDLWSLRRHPSQVYETLAAALVLVLAGFSPYRRQGKGMNFLLVVAGSACARIFMEAFRGDSHILPGGFREAQVIGLLVLTAALLLMRKWGEEPAVPAEHGKTGVVQEE